MSSEPASVATPASQPVLATEDKKQTTSEAISNPQSASDSKPVAANAPLETKLAAVDLDKSAGDSKTPVDGKPSEAVTEPPPTPLAKLFLELPSAIAESQHNEMWGVFLTNDKDVPTSIVLEKFLRANNKDVDKAKAQLITALKWRKEVKPASLLEDVDFDIAKFGGLGYVTVYPKTEGHDKEIVTWNIYGAVKDKQATFGNVQEFVKWRAALMELSLKELDLPSATVPIPSDGLDPYRMVQVHDYLNVSFLRMDPSVKAASKETIQTFSMAYPELLKEKFFVNVPLIMGWVFSAMKLFLSPETVKKFHPLSYGNSLAGELKTFGAELPAAYGGKGKDVTEGLTVRYTEPVVEEPKAAPVEEAKPAETKPAETKPAETKE